MADWGDIRKTIKDRKLKSKLWKADRKDLLRVIKTAEQWGLEAEPFARGGFPNMRAILPQALTAVQQCDRVRLADLLRWAGTLNTRELRQQLADTIIESIPVETINTSGEVRYSIELTASQLDRLRYILGSGYTFTFDTSEREEPLTEGD